jgi:hypothetical protein
VCDGPTGPACCWTWWPEGLRLSGDWDAAAVIHRSVPVDTAVLAGLEMAGAEIVPVTVNNSLRTAALWPVTSPTQIDIYGPPLRPTSRHPLSPS